MADANTDVTLPILHDSITAAIKARFPAFRTVEFYRDDETEKVPTPACLLEMTEAEPSGDPSDGGTGKLHANLRFEAHVIMQVRGPGVALELRKAATSLMVWLHQLGRFPGALTDRLEVISAVPDEWAPAHGGFQSWTVEFYVPALLGEDAWKPGPEVKEAYFSFAPDIGAANVHRYAGPIAAREGQP